MQKLENKYVVEMNNVISDFVSEQENLNKEMTVAELNSCLAKARMGFTSLKMCLDSATDIMQQKSGAAREHDFQLSIIYCCN